MPTPADPEEPFLHFLKPLEEAGLQYMVTGSVASMFYGEIRMTNGIDLVLFLPPGKAGLLEKLFPLDRFYCPPEEVIRIECARSVDGHFNLIHHETGFKADVYLAGNSALMLWGLGNARAIEFQGIELKVAPPEYVVVQKLEYFRAGGSEKHVRDIRAMMKIGWDGVEEALLEEKVKELGLQSTWEEVRSATG